MADEVEINIFERYLMAKKLQTFYSGKIKFCESISKEFGDKLAITRSVLEATTEKKTRETIKGLFFLGNYLRKA